MSPEDLTHEDLIAWARKADTLLKIAHNALNDIPDGDDAATNEAQQINIHIRAITFGKPTQ